MANVFI